MSSVFICDFREGHARLIIFFLFFVRPSGNKNSNLGPHNQQNSFALNEPSQKIKKSMGKNNSKLGRRGVPPSGGIEAIGNNNGVTTATATVAPPVPAAAAAPVTAAVPSSGHHTVCGEWRITFIFKKNFVKFILYIILIIKNLLIFEFIKFGIKNKNTSNSLVV